MDVPKSPDGYYWRARLLAQARLVRCRRTDPEVRHTIDAICGRIERATAEPRSGVGPADGPLGSGSERRCPRRSIGSLAQ